VSSEFMHAGMSAGTERYEASGPYWQERRRLAEELRRVANLLLGREFSGNDVSALADHLSALNRHYEATPEIKGRLGWLERGFFQDQDSLSVELSPLIGKSNGGSFPLKVWIENGEGRASVTCDWRFEGPPLCLHGGYVAALFDEFLGWVQMLSGGAGATKNLSVTYHKPTPLNVELSLRARLASVEGRKVRVSGEMYVGEVMTASAEGLFISFGSLGTRELYKNL
jgi:acyl-coenzyme A thioesterase PaaI-like protein